MPIQSVSTPAFGTTVRWDIPKNGDYLFKTWLQLGLAQLYAPAGNFACYANFAPYVYARAYQEKSA